MPHYLFFIIFTATLINQAISARNLDHPKYNTLHPHQQISFSMPHNILISQTRPNNNLPPFSKPLGYFPRIGGIPLTASNNPGTGARQPRTLDVDGLTLSFPAAATLQELELGTVATIDEDVYSGTVFVGKAEGVYVAAGSEGGNVGSSCMMAMTASFVGSDNNNNDKSENNGLRFFGVLKNEVEESHLAVIGGTGKYDGANGYATVKPLNISGESGDNNGSYKLLHFNVYLG